MAPITRKPRPVVQIVQCESAFPISGNKDKKAKLEQRPQQGEDYRPQGQRSASKPNKTADPHVMDFATASREIRSLGATAFVKQKKRDYEDEKYERLTGRKRKGLKVPLPILRGRAKKQAVREAAAAQQAKEAGVVVESSSKSSPSASKRHKRQHTSNGTNNRESRIYGPAPSVGFVSHGVLRVNPKRLNDV